MSEWISVEDRLPELAPPPNVLGSVWVLTWDGGDVSVGRYVTTPTPYWRTELRGSPAPITHWMPLPSPPND